MVKISTIQGRRSGRTQTPADDKDSLKEMKSKEPEGGKKGRGKRLAEEEPEKEVHSAEERSVQKISCILHIGVSTFYITKVNFFVRCCSSRVLSRVRFAF